MKLLNPLLLSLAVMTSSLVASSPLAPIAGPSADPDWSGASWIRRDSTEADDYTQYRRRFSLPAKPVARAEIYVSAVHTYSLHLDGHLVGKGQAYHYPQYQYYRAYDVTSLLRASSDHQLAVFAHWFGPGQGRPASARGLLLKLVVQHTDGTVTTLGTDAAWRASRASAWILGQPDRNHGEGIGFVECIDARKLQTDWTALAFDDSSWPAATVIGPHPVAPWTGPLTLEKTRIEEKIIAPAAITRFDDGACLIDLGKIHAGRPRIRFSGGTAGTIVTLRGGDTLDASGRIPLNTICQSTLMEYRAILSGASWVFEPVEYLGMRYVQIDNAPMPVTADNFEFIVRHAQLDETASAFESSDPALNAVWDLMKHSLFTCTQEGFLDTPTREKGGFLGDSVLQSTVAMPVLGERELTRRTLREFLHSMDQYWSAPADRGRINAVYPNGDGARDIPDYSQAYPLWAWTYYQETGDRAFLAEAYPKLCDVAAYVARHIDPATGLVTKLTGGGGAYLHGIVDWPATMRYGYDMSATARTVINGWAHADFTTLAAIADTLGRPADRDAYLERANALATAINARLLRPDGLYHDGLLADGTPSPHASQHANMFPLVLGIVPASHRAAVVEHVKAKGMSVGMVTLPWLLRALDAAGQGPALLDLFTNAGQPGWAQCLAKGATATWESWDADTTGQSLSHAWGASGLETYYRSILGIRPLKPGYDEVLIRPLDFGEKLSWAKGRIATDHGPLSVHWIRTAAAYTLHVNLPASVTARVALPWTRPGTVTLDGKPVPFSTEDNHAVIPGVGPGEHTLSLRAVP